MRKAEHSGTQLDSSRSDQSQPLVGSEIPVSAPTVFASVNTLASYLLEGYWDWQDESPRQWGSDTITINITDLTAAEQVLAVRAFLVWEDVCDITFVTTSGAANITFNNNGTGDAFCSDNVSGGLLTSATIQVSSDWDVGVAGGIYSYFFQTYVHEIGHALGLGHQGPYNGTSNYDVDAIFTNDTWRWSVMSYNDQDDADFGDTRDFVITPQMADILAVQSLYGAAQTRTGDTVYGFNSTAGAHYDFSQYFGTPAFTIYDWSGNNDRLDASGYSVNQTIDLTPGEWSSIGGEVHNIGIYLDTVIEDAFGGSARDIIIGNDRSNELRGNGGNDTLLGRENDDFLFGGSGDDQLDGGIGLDTADFTDITFGGVSVDLVNGTAFGIQSGTDTLISIERANGTLTERDIFFSNDADNVLDGNGGDDLFFGSLGNDVLLGEDGVDTVDYSGLSVGIIVDLQEQVGYQSAATATGKSDQLYQIEHINGTAFRDILAGSILANQLFGGPDNDDLLGLGGDDVLDGGTGVDYMAGGEHDDEYHVDHVNDVVEDGLNQGFDTVKTTLNQYSLASLINIEALEFTGSGNFVGTGNSNHNNLTGGTGADDLIGLDGNDTMDGAAGADHMAGGANDDTYHVDNTGDVVAENPNQGFDTIITTLNEYALASAADVEALAFGGVGNFMATGSDNDDVISGGNGNDSLDGRLGADQLSGGANDDQYFVDHINDFIGEAADEGSDIVFARVSFFLPVFVETLVLLEAGGAINGTGNNQNESLFGNSFANTLRGGEGNDSLNGGTGADSLFGEVGSDAYVLDSAGDQVVENANEGLDAIYAPLTYVLPANVEFLHLMGSGDIGGYGNALANYIAGNAGNNVLDGLGGADVMAGGVGNDAYFVDNSFEQVIENAAEGHDAVYAGATYVLSANVENLYLTGSSNTAGYGNTLANHMVGNAGNNVLDGLGGADVMVGGVGNDAYFVDNSFEQVIENGGEGNDAVYAGAIYVLPSNVENLYLTGGGNTAGYGNALINYMAGNGGNNVLDGRAGADAMAGGAGDDAYFVDNNFEQIIENAGEGNDAVYAAVNYVLPANVEFLYLTAGNTAGYGNAVPNQIVGSSGNNLLDGRDGADVMRGAAGNDAYFVDNAMDLATENAGEGTDAIYATVSYALAANVEHLYLQGAANLHGAGNSLGNFIQGNAGNNVLNGSFGADALEGLAGNDTFVFNAGQANGDVVIDFNGNAAAAGDSLLFVGYGAGVTLTNLNGTQWQLTYNGGTDHDVITFANAAALHGSDFAFV
jgi:Ca2+-binding RTX toxin-like protein